MRALPALSGRVVIAALERAGFEVARSPSPERSPARNASGILRQAHSAAPSFSIFSEQLPGLLLGSAEAVGCFLRGGKRHPLPTLLHRGEGLKVHSRPSMGAGRGGGDARQTDEPNRWARRPDRKPL
jgi:hypothetical protein